MIFALKEQNRIIGQLRREANANFMLLDDRSRRTQDLVQKLVGKVSSRNERIRAFCPISGRLRFLSSPALLQSAWEQ